MSSITISDKIELIRTSNSLVTLVDSAVTVGGQQFWEEELTLDTGISGVGGLENPLTPNTLYYIYVVIVSGATSLVGTTNSSNPSFSRYIQIGRMLTDPSSFVKGVIVKDKNDFAKVGCVEDSPLDEPNFVFINGPEWVLADGRSISGSLLNSYTGAVVAPELRGMFLRSKNNGKTSWNNPSGDLSLGNYDVDKTASSGISATGVALSDSHQHQLTNLGYWHTGYTSPTEGNQWATNYYAHSNGNHSHGGGAISGHNETVPRNMATNYYIKIN